MSDDKLAKILEEDIGEYPEKPKPKVTESEAEAAFKTLNLAENMSVMRQKAMSVWGRYSEEGGIGAPLLTTNWHSIGQLEQAVKEALEASREDGIEKKDKAVLLNIVVAAAKAMPELTKTMLDLEKRVKRPAVIKQGKNAPPSFAIHADNLTINENKPAPDVPK